MISRPVSNSIDNSGRLNLDDAMLKHIRNIVLTEHRPFSYRDFCLEVKDQPYAMTHGTYRNKVSMLNPVSKDISLPHIIADNHLKIHTIVHKTDTVTVSVACSFASIATDTDGLIRLSNALTRVEERTSMIVDECGNTLPGGYESIPNPEHGKWTVTLWHFGTDCQNYKELVEDKYCITWREGQNILGRIYNKKKHRKRSEIQELPNKSFKDALKEKFEEGES